MFSFIFTEFHLSSKFIFLFTTELSFKFMLPVWRVCLCLLCVCCWWRTRAGHTCSSICIQINNLVHYYPLKIYRKKKSHVYRKKSQVNNITFNALKLVWIEYSRLFFVHLFFWESCVTWCTVIGCGVKLDLWMFFWFALFSFYVHVFVLQTQRSWASMAL